MTPTSSYKTFRRRHPAGPLVVAGILAWALILILASCGEIRQGVKTVDMDRPQRPTMEFKK